MSRLDLNPLGSLLSIELVIPAVGLTGSQRGQTESFEQHLQHASQTVDLPSAGHSDAPPNGRAGADRPSPPEPADPKPSEQSSPAAKSNDDPSQGTSPSSTDQDQSTTTETQSEGDQQAAGSEAESSSDQESGVSEAESHANEENNEDEGQFAGDAAVILVEFVDVEAPSMPGNGEEVRYGASLPNEDLASLAGQGRAAKPVQQQHQSIPSNELPTGELEETDQPEVKTTTPEDPTAGPKADGEEAIWAGEQKTTPQRSARQSEESAGAGHERADGPSDVSLPSVGHSDVPPNGRADSEPLYPSAQSQGPAAHSPRQDGSQGGSRSVAERPSDGPLAERPSDGPPAEQVGDATTGPTASGQSEGQTATPTQAWSNQGMQQTSSARGQETSGPGQVDRVRFVQRVAGAFQAAGGRGGSVRLRLHPPELGSLLLEVSVKGGSMTARLEVETNAARTMLLDNLPALRDRLAEQEIRVGRFDVDLADQSADGSPQQPAQNPQSHDHPHDNATNTRSDHDPQPERPRTPAAVSQPGEGTRLDVII